MIEYYKRVRTCLLSTVLSFRLLARLRNVIGCSTLELWFWAHFMVFEKFTYKLFSSRLLSHFCSRICDALSRSLKWFVYFMSHTLCHIGCDFESNLKNLESNLKDPKNWNFPKFCHLVQTKHETGLGEDD